MPSMADLWLPIVVATLLVFLVSSILHMVLPHHRSDFQGVPDEASLVAAVKAQGLKAGNYHTPHVTHGTEARSESFQLKMKTEPMLILKVQGPGEFSMGRTMGQWLVYCLLVSALVAYLASHTLQVGASYLSVFRVAGFAGFLAFAAGQPIESIWYMRKWSSTVKGLFDGLVYGMVIGGSFGWLWPRLTGS